MNCESCRDLVFDFVYGLLDEPEAKMLREHIAECSACAVELEHAKADQLKIGQAALSVVEVPEFQLPAEELAAPVSETTPAVEPQAPKRKRTPVVAMAAWIGALASCLVVALVYSFQHRDAMAGQEAKVARLVSEHHAVKTQLAALDTKVALQQKEMPAQVNARARQLHVAGPGLASPGVSADYRVAVRDLEGQEKPAKIEVEFVDAKKNVLAKHSFDKAASVAAPESLAAAAAPVKMKVSASVAGKSIGQVEETIAAAAPSLAAHVTTNKVLYKPGDRVLVRALVLDRLTVKPAEDGAKVNVALVNDADDRMQTLELTSLKGIAAGELTLPADIAPGAYTLVTDGDRLSPTKRRLEVIPTMAPQVELLAKEKQLRDGSSVTLQFNNDKGKPAANEDVKGTFYLNNSVGQQLRNANAAQQYQNTYQNQVPFSGKTDGNGRLNVPVREIQNNVGRGLVGADGVRGKEETPFKAELETAVLPRRLAVDLFPESGHLIAGVPNRVFYRIRAAEGDEPVATRVALVAGDKSIYQSPSDSSVGVFTLTPDAKTSYSLKFVGFKQDDLRDPFAAVGIESDGVLLAGATSQKGDEDLKLDLVNRGGDRLVQVVAACRGQIVAYDRVTLPKDGKQSLDLPVKAEGVIRVTALEVKDGHLTPLAERLYYRSPARRLDIAVAMPTEKSPNSGPVQLKVNGYDEQKKPLAFWSLGSVVDERYRGDSPEPSLAAHFLILGDAPEGGDWSDLPVVGLDQPGQQDNLDLALGVFGWRQVSVPAASNPEMFARNAKDETKDAKFRMEKKQSVLTEAGKGQMKRGAALGAIVPVAATDELTFFYRVTPSLFEVKQSLDNEWQVAQAALIKAAQNQRGQLQGELKTAASRLSMARADLAELSARPRQQIMAWLGVLTLALLILGALAMVYGVARLARRLPATGAFGLACASLAACFFLMMFRPEVADDRGTVVQAPEIKTREFAEGKRPPAEGEKSGAERQANGSVPFKGGVGNNRSVEPGAKAVGLADAAGQEQMRRGAAFSPTDQLARRFVYESDDSDRKKNPAERRVALEPARGNAAPGAAFGSGMAGGGGVGGPPGVAANSPKAATKIDADLKKPAAPVPAPANLPVSPAAKDGSGDAVPPPGAPASDAAAGDRAASIVDVAKSLPLRGDLRALARVYGPQSPDATTLWWSPAMRIPAGGETLSIDVPAGQARYRVQFLGHTSDGRLGTYDGVLNSK